MARNVTGRTGLHQRAEIPEAYKNPQELMHEKSMTRKSLEPQILKLSDKEFEDALERLRAASGSRGRLWTEKEDEILKRMYHKVSLEKLSNVLGRSIDSVQKRATRLHLTGFK